MEAEKRETAMGAPFTQRASEGTAAAARASAARSGFTGTYCGADEVEQLRESRTDTSLIASYRSYRGSATIKTPLTFPLRVLGLRSLSVFVPPDGVSMFR